MHLRHLQRVAQFTRLPVSRTCLPCRCAATVTTMPPKVLLAAKPEIYEQQIGEKRKRIQDMFAKFDPPELEVFESERQNYRMR